MRRQGRTVQQKLASIASRQHGVVSRAQLLDAGLSAAAIQRLIRRGTLLRAYRGVYRVGHSAPSLEAIYLAAVKACGEGSYLSGRAAAYLHGLVKGRQPRPEVTSPTERRVAGIRTRRSRRREPRDVTRVRGIPVTAVARTLVDLAAVLDAGELARACHEAGVRYRTTPRQVEEVLARRPRSPGATNLKRVMRGDVHVTLSKLERRFLELLKAAGLPLPETNRIASGRRVDCRWPAYRLTVELNGYRYHDSRHAWERDHRRAREAYARGDEFRSYTYNDVFEDPRAMLRELRELFSAKRPA